MDESTKPEEEPAVSRRRFLSGLGGSLAAAAAGLTGAEEVRSEPVVEPTAAESLTGKVPVSLTVNGKKMTVAVDIRRTLLEMLRTDLDLTGAKQVCNHGTCGACTVIRDGKTIYSCLALAVDCDGAKVETVEGLARDGQYHPLQTAFVERDALQCGFCTSGFLMSCKALLDRKADPSVADVKDACAGNLCRCGTYPRIFDAVLDAARKGR